MAFQKVFVNEKTNFFIQNREYVKEILSFLNNNEISPNFKIYSKIFVLKFCFQNNIFIFTLNIFRKQGNK